MMSVLRRVRDILPANSEQPNVPEQPSTRLYRCDPCSRTYVSESMESCPECGETVETTPTGQDLGYL